VPKVTIRPDMMRPRLISGMENFFFIPKTWAMREPVHPPLPGREIATKVTKAMWPSSLMRFVCLVRVLWNSFERKRSISFE